MLWTLQIGADDVLALSIAHRCKAAFGLPSQWGMGKIHVGPTEIGKTRAKKCGGSLNHDPKYLPYGGLILSLTHFSSPKSFSCKLSSVFCCLFPQR